MYANRFSVLTEESAPSSSVENVDVLETRNTSTQTKTAPGRAKGMWICGGGNSLQVTLRVKTIDTGRTLQSQALVDSGATHCFIDEQIAILNRWNLNPLTIPVQLVKTVLVARV